MGYIVQHNNCGLKCEGSEDITSERSKNRHFRQPHSHLTPPLQRTPPTNICVNLTLLETRISELHFLPLTVYAQLCKFQNSLIRKPEHANTLDAKPETDFNAKWPFNVIYFGVNEEPLRGYIVKYDNCGLGCEAYEDIASKRSENFHFQRPAIFDDLPFSMTPFSFDAPSLVNPRKSRIST